MSCCGVQSSGTDFAGPKIRFLPHELVNMGERSAGTPSERVIQPLCTHRFNMYT